MNLEYKTNQNISYTSLSDFENDYQTEVLNKAHDSYGSTGGFDVDPGDFDFSEDIADD